MHPDWVAYYQAFSDFKTAQAADELRYRAELAGVTTLLMNTFDGIVSYADTGYNNPNGTRVWAWLPSTAYSYVQCAQKLTGAKRPANVIDFICFQNFGS